MPFFLPPIKIILLPIIHSVPHHPQAHGVEHAGYILRIDLVLIHTFKFIYIRKYRLAERQGIMIGLYPSKGKKCCIGVIVDGVFIEVESAIETAVCKVVRTQLDP